MYEDYYSILELDYTATQSDIKRNYRRLAKRWHPDVNDSVEATSKMQAIVQAYLILKDVEARERYDKIHEFYFRDQKKKQNEEKDNHSHEQKSGEKQYNDDFPKDKNQSRTNERNDLILDDWILKAKHQAKEFVFQSIRDAKGIANSGCKYTVYAIGITIIIFIAILVVIFIWGAFQ